MHREREGPPVLVMLRLERGVRDNDYETCAWIRLREEGELVRSTCEIINESRPFRRRRTHYTRFAKLHITTYWPNSYVHICKIAAVVGRCLHYEIGVRRCNLGGVSWIHSGRVWRNVEPVVEQSGKSDGVGSGSGEVQAKKRKKLKGKRAVVRLLIISKYRDALRAVRKYIPRLEQDLELLQAQNERKNSTTEEKQPTLMLMIFGHGFRFRSSVRYFFETESDTENEEKAEKPLYLDVFDKIPMNSDEEQENFEEHLRQISADSRKEKSTDKDLELADLDEVDRMVLRAASLLKKRRR
ncbi:putative CRM domain-containing protein, chloroplastic [Sesamum angolense]|uniref:CRM domain-containing protein, chloroplastic n=1 Tax=Sesamum angolense TaxID=2727404 RepID=A0AAE1XBD3_9LAMI|nr:putative CRM domain-containing protein, chloroplastic [Sesamum angolense]